MDACHWPCMHAWMRVVLDGPVLLDRLDRLIRNILGSHAPPQADGGGAYEAVGRSAALLGTAAAAVAERAAAQGWCWRAAQAAAESPES